ncbi:MAG TPA: M14 family zinc carboxypeptidase, partial [Solirubrobacteraceae bacterium]|nr:M14 family zinc carboxypeptidase [Solirubrobacteraceae bacterium]
MRRATAAVAACSAVAALAFAPGAAAATCTAGRSLDAAIPTWRAVNGFALGGRPATVEQVERYVAAVDRASPRVRAGVAGRSVQGRPIEWVAISDPEAVTTAALSALGRATGAMRAGTASAARARAFARDHRAFAYVGANVHGDEPSGTDADMRLLYEMAADRSCATRRRLDALVTVLLPMQNPDGRAAHTRTNAAGFDLNRDWFARTQPETEAKVELLEAQPPLLFVDQHEEAGSSFFAPPNADPVHHEIAAEPLHAIDEVLGPAVRAAFAERGWSVTSRSTYDLFFMGYGDTVPTTLFGAAGMTFEEGAGVPFADRVARHYLAADSVLQAAADHKDALLEAWARQWREARAQGARGELEPNRAIGPGDRVSLPVPAGRVYGYAIRTDVHGADAAALVDRLTSVGVVVDRLRAPATVALRAYGSGGTVATALAAGSYWVPLAQGAKHWVEAMLGADAYVPFPYFYDATAWSNP